MRSSSSWCRAKRVNGSTKGGGSSHLSKFAAPGNLAVFSVLCHPSIFSGPRLKKILQALLGEWQIKHDRQKVETCWKCRIKSLISELN